MTDIRVAVVNLLLCAGVFGVKAVHIGCYGKYTPYNGTGPVSSSYKTTLYQCLSACGSLCSFVRGDECNCHKSSGNVSGLARVPDVHCVTDRGGNLAGSVYCLKDTDLLPSVQQPILGTSPNSVPFTYLFESQLNCSLSNVGPKMTPPFCDYFPYNNPQDCTAFCNHLSAKYAVLGYHSFPTLTVESLPVCLCTNEVAPVSLEKLPTICSTDSSAFCGYMDDTKYGSAYCIGADCGSSPFSGDPPYCQEERRCMDGTCFSLKSIVTVHREDDIQVRANILCNDSSDILCNSSYSFSGRLLALETREKQDFIISKFSNKLEELVFPDILTSGYSPNCTKGSFDWEPFIPDADVYVNESIPDSFAIIPEEILPREYCFIWLLPSDSSWKGAFYAETQTVNFICQYDDPEYTTIETTAIETVSSTIETSAEVQTTTVAPTSSITLTTESRSTSATTSSTFSTTESSTTSSKTPVVETQTTTFSYSQTTTAEPSCVCDVRGTYGEESHYRLTVGQRSEWACPKNFSGIMVSSCISTVERCKFDPPMPYYSNCSSPWISDIKDQISDGRNASDILESVQEFTDTGSYFGHEIDDILNIVQEVVSLQNNQSVNLSNDTRLKRQEDITQTANLIFTDMLGESKTWRQLDQKSRVNASSQLIKVIEDVGFKLCEVAEDTGNCDQYTHDPQTETRRKKNVEAEETVKFRVYAISKENDKDHIIYRPSDTTGSTLSVSGYASSGKSCLHMVGFFLAGTQLKELYPVTTEGTDSTIDNLVTNSDLIGFSVTPQRQKMSERTDLKVRIEVENKIQATYPNQKVINNCGRGTPTTIPGSQNCSFWDDLTQEWSSHGCEVDWSATNATHTVCLCNHLTAFGNIMGLHDYECWPKTLDILTTVAELLSVVCLALTLFLHGVQRLVRGEARGSSERGAVLLQISFWLATSHILILLFMNRNWISIPDDSCIAVAIVLHFTLLASFGWMLVEGFLLYRMVVIVFDYDPKVRIYNILIGYGIPTVVVATTVSIAAASGDLANGYSNEAQCWLNRHNGYIWAFNAPVLLVALVNLIVLGMALHIASQSTKSKGENSSFTRRWVKGSLTLVFLMGVTWAFGMITFIEDIWPLYAFGILNGLQGVFIFIFQCLLNERMMNGIRRAISLRSKTYADSGLSTSRSKREASLSKKPSKANSQRRQTLVSRIPSNSSSSSSTRNGSVGSGELAAAPHSCKVVSGYSLATFLPNNGAHYNTLHSDSTSTSSVQSSNSSSPFTEDGNRRRSHIPNDDRY